MSTEAAEPEADVWNGLPRVTRRQVELERRFAAWQGGGPLSPVFAWLGEAVRTSVVFDRPEVDWRAAGLGRPGLSAQLRWPRKRTRLGLGVEVPIAHAVVDRLLGFDRPFAETRLQLTPVEWGVWTYLIVRCLEEINGSLDLSIDRVSPDPFDVDGLGDVVTVRWAVRVGDVAGAVRVWLPESLADAWIDAGTSGRQAPKAASPSPKIRALSADWRVVAGKVRMPGGLRRLRVGGVLPLADPPLTGTPSDPVGPIEMVCDLGASAGGWRIAVEPLAGSSARSYRVAGPLVQQPGTRTPLNLGNDLAMSPHDQDAPSPLDAPVTLTVELGRINLPMGRLADLKPGDVLEAGRHSREPVEITSNGRLVARGDLILIDTELGVRVTSVFL
ncbi:FliM/FliN family flagellar motor switch protein [Paludisphaera borealis]|uniref:Flagellar motor switch protein FliN n=1 Tax=Paludisphaera borealis TaxID=1387353 RepID=A0A1U7CTB3_9BACT|nr:FliM/FliN family flagellar motor switch protein [Paludisphaera borealis]APW62190.1 Flagellar motor switch protein FliN [Paludisphaera borealis]